MSKPINYKSRYKDIRPFVKFKVDMRKKDFTPSEKRQINKYYNLMSGKEGILSRPHVPYRPRSKENIKAARAYAEIPDGFPQIKTFPMPSPAGEDTKVKAVHGKLSITAFGITRIYEQFNKDELIGNFEGEVGRVINTLKRRRATNFLIQTGKFQINAAFQENSLLEKLNDLKERYSVGNITAGKKITEKNEFSVWANGIIGIHNTNPEKDEGEWFREFSQQRADVLKERRRARRNAEK